MTYGVGSKRMHLKKIDILDGLEEPQYCTEDSDLLEEIAITKNDSFDDHQQWMIDTFKDTLR